MSTSQPAPALTKLTGPKWIFLTILGGLGMIGPFSIDTIFPAFSALETEWGASEFALQQIISVYLLSYALMSLLHGPLSDALGRKPVIVVGMIVYVLAAVGSALAPGLGVLLFFRVIQGFSAGAGQIVSRAMVRDVFSDAQAQRTMSQIAMIFALAPALAPVIGGLLLGVGNWRLIFWFLAAFGVAILALVLFAMPETHPRERRTAFNAQALLAGVSGVWRNRDGRRLAFAGMANFAGQFLYISAAQLFVVKLLGLGAQDFWILFVPLIGGMMIGSWVNGRMAGRVTGAQLAKAGYLVSTGAGLLNLTLALIPGTQGLPWAILPLPLYTFGVALTFPIITLAMLDLFPTARGAASSVQSFVALLANAAIAGVLAPLLGFSLWSLAASALVATLVAWWLWRGHVRGALVEPHSSSDAAAFEPTDEL
ncbi:DHA1 family bicyclomycin/chloramphenicol resistance-like MFS transporter [Propionicimonas paludicola]|uniref:DHA1 family bicyclomycin/chloramphenicol resistance-like MFS transporter n=1 Tax=Propionicimonas paludicola TaxID=185243 RepID=A0A2A9CVK1_9ACTN|nr:multidrug effflux MFS transporter [Propionicimonas paludicola]PFG18055.1 DHA1 family bicyclomycin/chloramphenicol resistance-like MFS transporter [Propionicimonas paludicola]